MLCRSSSLVKKRKLLSVSFQWRIYIVKFWTRAPLEGQILSISCSFWEYLAKLFVGAPTSGTSWIHHWFRFTIMNPAGCSLSVDVNPILIVWTRKKVSSSREQYCCFENFFNQTTSVYYFFPDTQRSFLFKISTSDCERSILHETLRSKVSKQRFGVHIIKIKQSRWSDLTLHWRIQGALGTRAPLSV